MKPNPNKVSKAVNKYYWGEDWLGDYPTWDRLTDEQKEYLLRLSQIEREARIDELNRLSLHQATTSNGTDDIQVTLDYISKRISDLEEPKQ